MYSILNTFHNLCLYSENKTECELFDDTTTVETSDEDSNKRKRIQTCFTDYVTGNLNFCKRLDKRVMKCYTTKS